MKTTRRGNSFSGYDNRKKMKISPNSSFRISNNNNNNNNNIINKSNKKKPIWNSSTRLTRMDTTLSQDVTIDVFSLTREIHTPIGPPVSASERTTKEEKIYTTNKKTENLPGVQIYNIWSQKLAKDQVTAEAAWNRCRLITMEALDKFNERFKFLEEIASWEITSDFLLDYNVMEEKKREVEAGLFEVEDYDIEIKEVAKATQNVAQYLPPIKEREALKMRIITSRKRYFAVSQELAKKKELFRWLLPLLEQYRVSGSDIKSWLDATETRSDVITSNFNNNDIIIQNEDLIEEVREEIFIQKDVYEDFLDASEGIMDLLTNADIIIEIKNDHDHVASRWDVLCSNIEKCFNRLNTAKKLMAEQSCKVDPEKIEKKIRNEAKQCTCHNPFQIKRVGEGKYTFGKSKIVRLVRVHGSSIVVRVGGGWEYLYDFLFKTDPCRAKQAIKCSSQSMKSLNLSGLDLSPIDKSNTEFSMSVTRVAPKSWTPYRNRYERSVSLGSAASSSDNIDCDESSDLYSLSTSTGPSTPVPPRPPTRIAYTPNSRKLSHDSKLLGSLATMNVKNNRRLSLIERQTLYAEKKKMAQAFEERKI